MKKNLLFSLLFLVILGSNSCKKEALVGENADFVGYWYSEYNQLYIGEDGSGRFDRQKDGLSTYIDGSVRINDKFVIFSAGLISKKLKIDERPTFNNLSNQAEMTLKGEKYYSY